MNGKVGGDACGILDILQEENEFNQERRVNEQRHLHVCGVEDLARAASEISAVVCDELERIYNKTTNTENA